MGRESTEEELVAQDGVDVSKVLRILVDVTTLSADR